MFNAYVVVEVRARTCQRISFSRKPPNYKEEQKEIQEKENQEKEDQNEENEE